MNTITYHISDNKLPMFDPNIGTLLTAQVYMRTSATNTIFAENLDTLSPNEFYTDVTVYNRLFLFNTSIQDTLWLGNQININGYDGIIDYTGPGGSQNTISTVSLISMSPNLSAVTGSGFYNVTSSTMTFWNAYSSNYTAMSATDSQTYVATEVWTTYTYNPTLQEVPETNTIYSVIALCFMLTVFVSTRRKLFDIF
jgi:hypothetical protein